MKINNNTYSLESFDYKAHDIYICGDIDGTELRNITEKINDIVLDDDLLIQRNTQVMNETKLFTSNSKLDFNLPPINIYLSSYGGGLYPGLGIYDCIKDVGNKYQTNIICSGYVMSMATIILQAGKKRIARKNTTFMIHELADIMWYRKLEEIKDKLKEDQRLEDIIEHILMSRTKLTKDKLKEIAKNKLDYYINAEQALEYGLIDEII